jgi:hypothetical protein
MKPPTARDAAKPVAKITGGLILGALAGFFLPFLAAQAATPFAGPARGSFRVDPVVAFAGLAACVVMFVAVPLLWRRGLRGIPIGLCIGAALPTLLFAACASDSL